MSSRHDEKSKKVANEPSRPYQNSDCNETSVVLARPPSRNFMPEVITSHVAVIPPLSPDQVALQAREGGKAELLCIPTHENEEHVPIPAAQMAANLEAREKEMQNKLLRKDGIVDHGVPSSAKKNHLSNDAPVPPAQIAKREIDSANNGATTMSASNRGGLPLDQVAASTTSRSATEISPYSTADNVNIENTNDDESNQGIPCIPILEATLVEMQPSAPVYDAVLVRVLGNVNDGNEEGNDEEEHGVDQWELVSASHGERVLKDPQSSSAKKRCLLLLAAILLVGAGVGVALGLTLGGSNDKGGGGISQSNADENDALSGKDAVPPPQQDETVDGTPSPSPVVTTSIPAPQLTRPPTTHAPVADRTETTTTTAKAPVADMSLTAEEKEEIAFSVLKTAIPSSSYAALTSDPESVPNQALDWVLNRDAYPYDWTGISSDPIDETAKIDLLQRYVLGGLFLGTGGNGWSDGRGWMSSDDVCTWSGIECGFEDDIQAGANNDQGDDGNDDGKVGRKLQSDRTVTKIVLVDNALSGFLPEDLPALPSLTVIEMHENRLRGTIPSSIFELTELDTLFLDANRLEGQIPQNIAKLTKLRRLTLNDNRFVGTIPTEIGQMTTLVMLWLFNNGELEGRIPTEFGNLVNLESLAIFNTMVMGRIPTQIGNLQSLKIFKLENNLLSGALPNTLYDITSLEVFGIAGNRNITGSLSPRMGSWTKLRELYISETSIGGSLPEQIGELTELSYLSATSTELSGPLPTTIGNLSNVQFLELGNNNFNGTLPPRMGDMTGLISVLLYGNRFTGALPSTIGGWTNVSTVDMSENTFAADSGLPTEIGLWTNCEVLAFQEAGIGSTIPSEIGGMSALKVLDLSLNHLTGEMPVEVGNLNALETFNVEENQIEGPIPTQIGQLMGLTRLVMTNNFFNSAVPTEIGNLINLETLALNFNRLTGQIPDEITQLDGLTEAFLEINSFSGTIPANIGNMASLESFTAFRNKRGNRPGIGGPLPESLGRLSSLNWFDVAENSITGEIPIGLGDLSENMEYLYLNENSLEGSVPSELGNLVDIRELYLDNNGLTGQVPEALCGDADIRVDCSVSCPNGCCTNYNCTGTV